VNDGLDVRLVALVLDEDPARAILKSHHVPTEPPPIARARSPDWPDPIDVDRERFDIHAVRCWQSPKVGARGARGRAAFVLGNDSRPGN
jgi:hypothetical protein